jgi:hypothetical protein
MAIIKEVYIASHINIGTPNKVGAAGTFVVEVT